MTLTETDTVVLSSFEIKKVVKVDDDCLEITDIDE